MRLRSRDGAWVELRPVSYQFGPDEPDDWDRNWLVVRGEVHLPEGAPWSFEQPCLTTWEARRVGNWLQAVGQQEVPASPSPPDEDDEGLLSFVEPNVGFSLASATSEEVCLRLHLSLESAPPWAGPESPFHALLRVTVDDLLRAAEDWNHDLEPFPER